MADPLLELIELFAERLSLGGTSPNGGPIIPYFQKLISDIPSVSRLENGWIDLGGGKSRSGTGYTLFTIERMLKKGKAPSEIAEQLIREIDQNSFKYLEVYAVEGIEVQERMALDKGFYLTPNKQLPQNSFSQIIFGHYGIPFPILSDMAALVYECEVSPAIRDEQVSRKDRTKSAGRQEYVQQLRLALGLATGVSVEIDIRTELVSEETIFFDGSSGMSGLRSQLVRGPQHLLNTPAKTLRLKNLIQDMEGSDAIRLAAERLIKSRRHPNTEDRIIDLGMAAEIALMHQRHGAGDGKGEITNKISSRAAWLLGKNTDDRVTIFDQIRDLYSARSITVHTGKTPEKFHSRPSDWDKLVTDILTGILERGSFPDWKRLTLA